MSRLVLQDDVWISTTTPATTPRSSFRSMHSVEDRRDRVRFQFPEDEAAKQAAVAKAAARFKRLQKVKDFCVKRTLLIVITVASFGAAAFLVVMGLNAQHEQNRLRDDAKSQLASSTMDRNEVASASAAPSMLLQQASLMPGGQVIANNGVISGRTDATNNVQGAVGGGGGGSGPSSAPTAMDSSLIAVDNLAQGQGVNNINNTAVSGGSVGIGLVGGGATTNNVVTPGGQGQLEKNSLVVDQSQSVLAGGEAVTIPQNRAVTDKPMMEVVELNECPEKEGLQLYPHPKYCDQFYKCVNGTFSLEFCENGLLFDGKGAVHNYCNYHWAVDCGKRASEIAEVKSPGCPYRFGIFPKDSTECATSYYKCAFGIPQELPCEPGLAYDNRIHQCNWPDLTPKCDPETIVGFECPEKLPPGSLAVKFMPFPRFDAGRCDSLIVCVNGYPRLIRCTEEKVFNKLTLSCDYPENVPECANYQPAVRE